jgi:cytochrome P450
MAIRSSGILRFLRNLTESYGDVVTYRVPGRRTVLVNRPDLARQVLLEQVGGIRLRRRDLPPLEFIQWPAANWTRTGDRTESVARRVSGTAPPSADAVDRIATLVDSCCDQLVAHWLTTGTVELAAAMGTLTAALIRSVLLGLESDVEASQVFSDAMLFALSDGRLPAAAGHADRDRWRATVRELRDEAMSRSRYHGKEAAQQASGFAPLVMASYSPTAAALTWITYLLATHPDTRAALAEATPNAPHLKAVVRESLRLYPPGLALVRFTHEPTTLGEYTLPTGTRVLVSPYLLQRHPDLWPQPDIFRPERFSEQSTQQAYLPFGLGPGTCPGKAITILLLHHTVSALARRIVFRPRWAGEPRPELRWALLPDRPLPAVAEAAS